MKAYTLLFVLVFFLQSCRGEPEAKQVVDTKSAGNKEAKKELSASSSSSSALEMSREEPLDDSIEEEGVEDEEDFDAEDEYYDNLAILENEYYEEVSEKCDTTFDALIDPWPAAPNSKILILSGGVVDDGCTDPKKQKLFMQYSQNGKTSEWLPMPLVINPEDAEAYDFAAEMTVEKGKINFQFKAEGYSEQPWLSKIWSVEVK